jgi:16S rRNA (cytosine967-C5)-methyltransferase
MADARSIVFQLLSSWTTLHNPPFLPERTHPGWAAMTGRDRAFAFDLLTGVMRWRGTLDAVLATRVRQTLDGLEPPIRAALWLGAYQLLFQGTASYAAVDTAVTLAKQHNPAAGGLVNAVLRAITRLKPRRMATREPLASRLSRRALALDFGTDLCFGGDVFVDPAVALATHLAQVRSHPRELVEHVLGLYGEQAGAILLRNNQRSWITLRADAGALDVPSAAGLAAHGETDHFVVAVEGWNEALERLVEAGTLSPQDPTAAKPVRRVAALMAEGTLAKPGGIVDLCAGLGTKTIQLARAFPQSTITATDVDTVKLARLQMRAKSIGLRNVEVASPEELKNQSSKINNALVLADVPCSNTGVMGRRVQSRWRWPTLDRGALGRLQEGLLRQAAELAGDNGVVVYATCSIDAAENGGRVGEFLGNNPGYRVVAEEVTLPSLTDEAARVHDGGYYAVVAGR